MNDLEMSLGMEFYVQNVDRGAVARLIDELSTWIDKKKAPDEKGTKAIIECCSNITGLGYKIEWIKDPYGLAVMPHIAVGQGGLGDMRIPVPYQKDVIDYLKKNGLDKQINPVTFDPKTGKFEGKGAKDVTNTLYIPKPYFTKGKFTAREVAGGLLHELGHSVAHVMTLGNIFDQSIIATTSLSLAFGDNKNNKFEIDGKKILIENLKGVGEDGLARKLESGKYTQKDIIEAGVKASPYSSRLVNQSVYKGSGVRDEQHADFYAVKAGLGKESYDMLTRMGGVSNNKLVVLSAMFYTFRTAVATAGTVGAVAAGVATPLVLVVPAAVILYQAGGVLNIDPYGGSYDNWGERYSKIIQGMRQELRNADLPDSEKRVLLKDIDEMEKNVKDDVVWTNYFQLLNPNAWSRKNAIQSERALERLINNPLFTSSVRYKLSGSN